MKNNTSASINDMHDPIHGLDSNLLKVAVGLSALVFIIMLQAHHNHDPDSPHSGYIAGVCHNIAVEVFDSVSVQLNKCETGPYFLQNFQCTTMFISAYCKICELNTEHEIVFAADVSGVSLKISCKK